MLDILYNSMLPLGSSLSLGQLRAAGDGLGRLMWAMLRGRRRETTRAIAGHLGLSEKQAAVLGAASFRHTACSFLELFFTRNMDVRFFREHVEFSNPDLMLRMGQSTRPLVAVSAHIGCWELLVGLMSLFPGTPDCQGVVRLPKDKALAAVIMHMRSQPGMRIVPHRDASAQTLPHLRKGGRAGFLVDHNCRHAEAEFLPFLGEIAAVNKGPAILALRTKAEVWPIFPIRLPGGRVRVVVFDPLDTAALEGPRQERITAICRFYTDAVERIVRSYPEQWFWMHRRWKTQPRSVA